MLFRFIEKLQQDIAGKGVKQQLEILCSIYALHLLHKHLGDFLSTGCITPKQASLANEQLRSLYPQVCPQWLQLIGTFWCLGLLFLAYETDMFICLVRFVLMRLRLLMRLTTLITTLVRFLAATMEMCIQSCTRRHGRIHWMIQLCQMAFKSMFDQCWSNNFVMLDSKVFYSWTVPCQNKLCTLNLKAVIK